MRILQFLFCLLLCSFAVANTTKNKLRESLFSSFKSEGKVSLFLSSMPGQNSSESDKDSGGLDLNLKFEKELNSAWSLSLNPYLHLENSAKAKNTSTFDPQEAALIRRTDTSQFIIGFHKVAWEGTDVINPMDIFNPKIFLNPLSSMDRASAGFFYLGQTENANWQFLVIPKQSTSVLPNENSPWWPRQIQLPTQSEKLELRIGQNVQYRISADQELDHALANNVAFRFNYNLASVDLSLAAAEAAANLPILSPTLNVTPIQLSPTEIYSLNSPVILTPYYYRRRIAAASFVWTRETQILRFASQYAQSIGDSKLLPSWSTQSVLELEQNLNFKNTELSLIAELVHSTKPETNNMASISGVFDRGALLGFRWPLSEQMTWIGSYYQDLVKTSSFVHNELKISHNDQFSSEFFLDLFQGSADSIIGAYDKNDQIRYQLNYSF